MSGSVSGSVAAMRRVGNAGLDRLVEPMPQGRVADTTGGKRRHHRGKTPTPQGENADATVVAAAL